MMEEKPKEISGLDTIRALVGEPPHTMKIPYKMLERLQTLLMEWNLLCIAIIPYCYKCKRPLVWHFYSKTGTLFHCPECGREWIKDGNWNKDKEKK